MPLPGSSYMKKSEQVSSDHQKMSLVVVLRSDAQGRGRAGGALPLPYPTMHLMLPTPLWTDRRLWKHYLFLQFRLRAVTSSQELLSWAKELIGLVNWTCLRWLSCIIYSVQTQCSENVARFTCQSIDSCNGGLYCTQLLHWSRVINLNHL